MLEFMFCFPGKLREPWQPKQIIIVRSNVEISGVMGHELHNWALNELLKQKVHLRPFSVNAVADPRMIGMVRSNPLNPRENEQTCKILRKY